MKKKRSVLNLFLAILFIVAKIPLHSQDLESEFEEFRNEITNSFDQTAKQNHENYYAFLDSLNNLFTEFLRESDREFCNLLKSEWQEYNLFEQNITDTGLKAQSPKQYTSTEKHDSVLTYSHTYGTESLHSDPLLNSYLSGNTIDSAYFDTTCFDFFGTTVKIPYDKSIFTISIATYDKNRIGNYWNDLSQTAYFNTLNELKNLRDKLNLNGWAYYLLLNEFSENLFPSDNNTQNLIKWFLGIKSGFNYTIGINMNNIYLLLGSNYVIYEKPGIKIKETFYYITEGDPEIISTYTPAANRGENIDLGFSSPLLFPQKEVTRKVNVKIKGIDYNFTLSSNKNLIDFYNSYPITSFQVYNQSFLSEIARESLTNQIYPILAGKSDAVKTEILLEISRQITSYEVDRKNFGREKYFFPEESLFYEKSDCEDRTLMLSFLLNEFLNINSIGVSFKDHILLGVPVYSDTVRGIKIDYNKRQYILIDPSYSNAPPGVISPELNGVIPKIYDFTHTATNLEPTVNFLNGIAIEDIIKLNDGRSLFCGFLYDTLRLENKIIVPGMFTQIILGYIKDNENYNVLVSNGKGNSHALKLQFDIEGNLYVLGSYTDDFSFLGLNLTSKEEDFFLLKTDSLLNPIWITPLRTSQTSPINYYFTAVVDKQGHLIRLNNNNLCDLSSPYGLNIDQYGNCIVSGFLGNVPLASDSLVFKTGDDFDIVDWLVRENNRLIKTSLNPEITPLLSVLNFIMNSNLPVSGENISESFILSKENPNRALRSFNFEINNIESLNKIREFILLKTSGSQTLKFDRFLFSDNSRFKIYDNPNEIRLFVYSGVNLNESNMHYKINYFLIDKYSASLMFDYDQHYRKTIAARQIKN